MSAHSGGRGGGDCEGGVISLLHEARGPRRSKVSSSGPWPSWKPVGREKSKPHEEPRNNEPRSQSAHQDTRDGFGYKRGRLMTCNLSSQPGDVLIVIQYSSRQTP